MFTYYYTTNFQQGCTTNPVARKNRTRFRRFNGGSLQIGAPFGASKNKCKKNERPNEYSLTSRSPQVISETVLQVGLFTCIGTDNKKSQQKSIKPTQKL